MENPWPISPFLVKKRQFCQNNSTFWVHKVNKIPLFSDVFQKNQRSHAHVLSKIIYSLKTHFSFVHVLSKNANFSQKNILTNSHMIFQIFACKTSCFHTHIKSNNFNSVKTKLYYGSKKSIRCLFFPIFHEKNLLSCPHIVIETSVL